VEVVRLAPAAGTDTRVLVLEDSLDAAQRDSLLDWIESGGVAVVADPASSLHGGPGLDGGSVPVTGEAPVAGSFESAAAQSNVLNESCTIGALLHIRGVFVRDGLLFPVGDSEPHCLAASRRCRGGDGADDVARHAFVIRRGIGDGVVVGLGDNRLLTNSLIRFADNSGLAVALLAPDRGARVDVLVGSSVSRRPTTSARATTLERPRAAGCVDGRSRSSQSRSSCWRSPAGSGRDGPSRSGARRRSRAARRCGRAAR
jgi:hypothetical protein